MSDEVLIDRLVLRVGRIPLADAASIARLVAEGLAAAEWSPSRREVEHVEARAGRSAGASYDRLAGEMVTAVLKELERVG